MKQVMDTSPLFARRWSRMPAGGRSSDKELGCDVWIIEHDAAAPVRGYCLESSPTGVRLLLPLGSGIAVGQMVELRARLWRERALCGASLLGDAWIAVASVRIRLGGDAEEDLVEVCGLRYPLEKGLNSSTLNESAIATARRPQITADLDRRKTHGYRASA